MSRAATDSLSQQIIDLARKQAGDLANGFQVEPDIVAAAMLAKRTRIPGGPFAQITQINTPLWHHVNHTNASVSAASSYVCFNEAKSDFVSNFSNGQIPSQTVFALTNVGVELVTGMDRLGTLSGSNAGQSFANSTAPELTLEIKRQIMETGFFQLKFQGKELFTMNLLDLPIGGGLDCATAFATTATTTSMAAAYGTNGAPFAGNARAIGDGAHLLPGGGIVEGKIILPTAIAMPSNVYAFWKVKLFGSLFFK
jgi:hypothetical protein